MSFIHSPKIVTSGLVLALDVANTKSYPGSGVTWTDLSGNKNNVTLTNGPTYSGTNAGILSFASSSTQYADFFAPNLGTLVTVEMWANMGSGYGSLAGNAGKMPFGWNLYDAIIATDGFGYNTGNGDVYGISAATVTSLGLVNNWKHYTFEMRSDVSYTNNKMYINGSLQSLSQQVGTESAANRTFNSGNGRISGWRYLTGTQFNMSCSLFRVYNRSLSPTEIIQNFNATRGRFGL